MLYRGDMTMFTLVILCLIELTTCASLWKRTIVPELDRNWLSEKDPGAVDAFNLGPLKERQFESPTKYDVGGYDLNLFRPRFGGEIVPVPIATENRIHPWQEYDDSSTGERLYKAFKRSYGSNKRTSLQDLLRTLQIQDSYRFKPMRFGAGVGKK